MSFFESAQRQTSQELTAQLNSHLESRMFIVGHSITVADIINFVYLLSHFVRLAIIKYLCLGNLE